MKLIAVTPDEAPAMASAHAQAFDTPWDEANFRELLAGAGVYGFLVSDGDVLGVVLCRAVAGEAEVLTVAVPQWARRRGIGRTLMEAALHAARERSAAEVFLEVDVANTGAVALYEGLGFRKAGLRKGYYDRGAQPRADALVMRLDLRAQSH
jgi:[ribosomal protein S18]-alanine N-acetyltransferase